MITLFGSARTFGWPNPSPFVTKAEVLLRMAGIKHDFRGIIPTKAPKGKIPYISDDGTMLGDSTFIRWHLEQKHGADFSGGYSAPDLAAAWAFEKMCEEHLYWAVVDLRWAVPENFDRGPREFFKVIPAFIRPLVLWRVRRDVTAKLHAQGFGRHTRAEIERLAIADLKAISDFLGNKPFLLGERPCGADASVFAAVHSAACEIFTSPIRDAVAALPNLEAYRQRMLAAYYPEGPQKQAR